MFNVGGSESAVRTQATAVPAMKERKVMRRQQDRSLSIPPPAEGAVTAGTADPVEEADIESFPASDPPAWTAATVTRLEKGRDGDRHEINKKGGKTTP